MWCGEVVLRDEKRREEKCSAVVLGSTSLLGVEISAAVQLRIGGGESRREAKTVSPEGEKRRERDRKAIILICGILWGCWDMRLCSDKKQKIEHLRKSMIQNWIISLHLASISSAEYSEEHLRLIYWIRQAILLSWIQFIFHWVKHMDRVRCVICHHTAVSEWLIVSRIKICQMISLLLFFACLILT